jgi:2-aminoadipate transaminase
MINYERFYSANAAGMKKSIIRELLKLTGKPGIISFAGGLPAPDMFPVQEITEIVGDLMAREGEKILQYGPTEGYTPLREELLQYMKRQGVELSIDQLVVITSSQQGLDLVGKIFVDRGDVIMMSKPTYVGAIQAFNSYSAHMCGIELEDDGIDTGMLEREIKKFIAEKRKPKFIYVVPDFQNPSGITVSLEKRKELIRIAVKYDLLIVEDSPYKQLRFEGEHEPSFISLNSERVVSLYTFSKILLPGFRLGWMVGPESLIQKAVIAKQAVDLCAPPFNQAVFAEFIKKGLLEKQVAKIITAYREKRDFMLAKLDRYMPDLEGLKWTRPQGGLFLWLTLPGHMDATEMFTEALEKNVAYVIGSAFDPEGKERNTMRLNFSFASKEQIDQGIKRLAEVIKNR